MTVDQVMGAALRLDIAMETMAALGARLRLVAEQREGDVQVTAQLDHLLDVAGLGEIVAGLEAEQAARLAGFIRAFFLQAVDLLDEPARPPGWQFEDPTVLAGQGAASAVVPTLIAASLPHLDGLSARLERPASMLDIGSGVAALSCAACHQWPALRVVGVDPWEPSMALARKAVAGAGLTDRIELRECGVEELEDVDCHALVWVPGPFLAPDVLPRALAVAHRALEPDGWAILGLYEGPDDPRAVAVTDLRTIRSGGQVLGTDDASALLVAAGFDRVAVLPRPWEAPMRFVVGHRT